MMLNESLHPLHAASNCRFGGRKDWELIHAVALVLYSVQQGSAFLSTLIAQVPAIFVHVLWRGLCVVVDLG